MIMGFWTLFNRMITGAVKRQVKKKIKRVKRISKDKLFDKLVKPAATQYFAKISQNLTQTPTNSKEEENLLKNLEPLKQQSISMEQYILKKQLLMDLTLNIHQIYQSLLHASERLRHTILLLDLS